MPSINRASGSELIVSYPGPDIQQCITQAEYDFILYVWETTKGKVYAIKFIKTQYNLGLREAKIIVDMICDPQYKTMYQIT